MSSNAIRQRKSGLAAAVAAMAWLVLAFYGVFLSPFAGMASITVAVSLWVWAAACLACAVAVVTHRSSQLVIACVIGFALLSVIVASTWALFGRESQVLFGAAAILVIAGAATALAGTRAQQQSE